MSGGVYDHFCKSNRKSLSFITFTNPVSRPGGQAGKVWNPLSS